MTQEGLIKQILEALGLDSENATPREANRRVTLAPNPPNVTSGRVLGLWECIAHQIKALDLASSFV